MTARAREVPPGFDELSVDEQVAYLQFLWERIAPRVDALPVPPEHAAVLNARIQQLEEDPEAAEPADVVVQRLRDGLAKS